MLEEKNLLSVLEQTRNQIGELAIEKPAFDILFEKPFKSFISNDDKCSQFVSSVMNSYFEMMNIDKSYKLRNKHRASHSVITWLLGIAINKMLNIYNDGVFLNAVWTNTSVLHDYGYLIDETKEDNLDITKIITPYNLFTDKYTEPFLQPLNGLEKIKSDYFSYEYDEYLAYFEYSKWFHKNHIEEKCDHGIVGACKLFNYYCDEVKKEYDHILPSILHAQVEKLSFINIASHNIYKSNYKNDNIYKTYGLTRLLSTSPKRVTKGNGLLMLISLVDTIDCSKKLSRCSENEGLAIYRPTILKNININFKNNGFVMDYTNLMSYINRNADINRKKKTLLIMNSFFTSILGLSNWTDYKVTNVEEYKFFISL